MRTLTSRSLRALIVAASPLAAATSVAQTPYQAAVLADNPASYWSFEETSGTTIADNQGLNNGTVIGAPILNQPGAPGGGQSIRFASGGYVKILNHPSITFTETFTIEMWIKPTSTSGQIYILDKDYDEYSVILGYQGANSNFFSRVGYPAGVSSAQMPVVVNDWQHIVYVKDANGLANNWRGYLNGCEFFSVTANFTLPPAVPGAWPASRDLHLGGSRNAFNYYGYLDEVAVYSHALSGSQVAAHYAAATGTPPVCGPNAAPTAVAGADQSVHAGDTVHLDGSASFDDNTASTALAYSWTFSSKPAGSGAVLLDDDSAQTSFVADLPGTYVADLVVTDEGALMSAVDQVEVSSNNLAPSAVAGDDQLVIVGNLVQLDGTGSTDPELDALTFSWSIASAPAGSSAALNDPTAATPTFVPDLEGLYVVTLTASDFIGPGTPDTVEVTASSVGDYAQDRIMCGADLVSQLTPGQVTTKGNQTAFLNFLRQATTAIQDGDTAKAIDKLEKCIARTDGCESGGSPDGNGHGRDWVTDCAAQAEILACLRAALTALTQ